MTFDTIKVLHMDFIKSTFANFISQLDSDLKNNQSKFIVTANPEIALYADNHQDYLNLVNSSDYTTPDGIGIVKAAKTLGTPIPERITGYDVMLELLKIANTNKYKIYFLGAKPDIIKDTVTKVKEDFPDIVISGYHDGYFKNDQTIQSEIVTAQPNIVFAALGYPKQEFFLAKLQPKLKQPAILMGVGGSFDVLSGNKKRAPKFMQNLHLEWAYRLMKEPTRIGRMLAIPKFMIKVQQSKK